LRRVQSYFSIIIEFLLAKEKLPMEIKVKFDFSILFEQGHFLAYIQILINRRKY